MEKENLPFGYIIDLDLREKYKSAGKPRSDSDVTHFIIHGTAGSLNFPVLKKWMMGGERSGEYNRSIGIVPFYNDRNGCIYDCFNPHLWYYTTSSGQKDKCTLPVEFINPHKNNRAIYTPMQYKSGAFLFAFCLERFSKMKIIQGHNAFCRQNTGIYTRQGRAKCPGDGFDYDNFCDELSDLKFKFDFLRDEEKIIIQ